MRAIFSNKIWVVVLSLASLAALTVLATGLGNIEFQEGQPFGREESTVARSVSISAAQSIFTLPFQTQLAFWIMFVLIFALVGLMLSPELRKRLIKIAIRVALTYWVLFLLFNRYQEVLAQMNLNLNAANEGTGDTAAGAPIPEFAPPQAASWISYALTFIIISIVLFIAWKVYSFWKEANAPPTDFSKERIAKIARASIRDISSGRESTDVILNCYYRMGDAVSLRKNLDRHASMTPSEFASRLENAGFPPDAVRTLTRLFESVRYGGRKSDPKMTNEAVACLTSILQYCGEPA